MANLKVGPFGVPDGSSLTKLIFESCEWLHKVQFGSDLTHVVTFARDQGGAELTIEHTEERLEKIWKDVD